MQLENLWMESIMKNFLNIETSSYSNIEKYLNIAPNNDISFIIERLKTLESQMDNACQIYVCIDILENFFAELDISVNDSNYSGSCLIIYDKETILDLASRYKNFRGRNVYKAWSLIINGLVEDIEEFYRYSARDNDEDVIFLKRLLFFLCSIQVVKSKDLEEVLR